MKKLKENDIPNAFIPKTERILLGRVIKNKKNRNRNKNLYSNINLIKNPFVNLKYQLKNNIKFPKLSAKYPNSLNTKLKLNHPRINSSQILEGPNLSFLQKIPYRHLKELSVNIFQSNDIDLVRNLNPDSNQDLVSNLLFKEQLKNTSFNLSNYFKKENEEKNNISKRKGSKNEGDMPEDKNFQSKIIKIKQSGFIEKELNQQLKELRDNYIIKKEEKIKIDNKFKEKLNEIDNIEYDIQFLENETQLFTDNSKFSDNSPKSGNNGKNQNSNQNNKNKKENQPQENEEDNESKMSKYAIYLKDKKKREAEKLMKQKKIFELKQDINQLKVPFNSICQEINELKNTERNTKQKLMRHYLELLYNGKEIRSDGLIWIIKAIWKMGENVPLSFMPTFLDLDAIKYLFNMTRISIELDSIKKYIYDIKRKLKEKVNIMSRNKLILLKDEIKEESKTKFNNDNDNNDIVVKKTNNDINTNKMKISFLSSFVKNKNSSLRKGNRHIFKKKLIKSLSTPDIIKKLSVLSQNSILNMSHIDKKEGPKETVLQFSKKFEQNEKNQLDITSLPEVIEIKKLRKKILILNEKKEEMKKNEIKRIFNEYANNDYEKIYNAPIDIVLGALLGEHSRNIEVSNFNIFKKGFLEEVKNLRFFEYVRRK